MKSAEDSKCPLEPSGRRCHRPIHEVQVQERKNKSSRHFHRRPPPHDSTSPCTQSSHLCPFSKTSKRHHDKEKTEQRKVGLSSILFSCSCARLAAWSMGVQVFTENVVVYRSFHINPHPIHCFLNCRNKHGRGHVRRVRCESSAAMVPKDKAVKRFVVSDLNRLILNCMAFWICVLL